MKKIIPLILILSVLPAQDTKTLTLKTGDKITGTIVSETETTITIINPLMGQMTLNKADLKQETVSITLNSGDVVKGIVLEKTPSYFKLQSAFGEVTIPTENIKTIGNIKKKDENAPLKSQRTLFGTRWEQAGDAGSGEWYFSKERLMDVWFDPTGYTIEKNKLYFSGLSWGFGLTDRLQITSKWTNYFWQDFNLRPKINLFKTGNVDSQIALAAGGHLHTRGLPGKYKWIDEPQWEIQYEWNSNTGTEERDSTLVGDGRYVALGATQNDDGYWDDDWGSGDKMWFEVFGAITSSKLRDGGNGRINTTLGASAVFYPGEDVAPRIYLAADLDITKNIKAMGEIFYDAHYPETINFMDNTEMSSPIHFDIGFLTNRIGLDDRLWVGIHFQRPYISFYWKF
ncbi:MAG: hypothetical protein HOB22_04015 [Candidatus Marinimicrobia bacterium]|nr:hypothetical protein [Candidatus Neomarinimicrobiota bacterium]